MSNKTFTLSLVMLLVAISTVTALSFRPVPVVVQTNLEKLPMVISGYIATEDSFSNAVYKELNADENIYRHYKSQNGDQLDLYIGYYGTAKGGRTGHNPYACLPGAGWAIVDSHKMGISLPNTTSDTELDYVHARRDGINTVMVHWYQTAGSTVISTGIQQNIKKFLGRILRNRNDGAFIQITSQVPDEMVAGAEIKTRYFAENVLQLLPEYWPVEQ